MIAKGMEIIINKRMIGKIDRADKMKTSGSAGFGLVENSRFAFNQKGYCTIRNAAFNQVFDIWFR